MHFDISVETRIVYLNEKTKFERVRFFGSFFTKPDLSAFETILNSVEALNLQSTERRNLMIIVNRKTFFCVQLYKLVDVSLARNHFPII